ncbi:MAG: hypothetical protein AAGI70_05390, partial [Pseudomonadota bacterium]
MRHEYGFMTSVCVAAVLALGGAKADAAPIFIDWGVVGPDQGSFTLNGSPGTVRASADGQGGEAALTGAARRDTAPGFDPAFFGEDPTGQEFGTARVSEGTAALGGGEFSLEFSFLVKDPLVHFLNLTASVVDFSATPATPVFVSGNPQFEVARGLVNTLSFPSVNSGCEAPDGSNPNGGCGSVQLFGLFSSISFSAIDQFDDDGADAFAFTLSIDSSTVPLPGS